MLRDLHNKLALALSFDPFAGDFSGGGEGDRVLSDKLVKTRKAHAECSHCAEPIAAGEINRVRKEIYDDELETFRWCQACVETMAADDDGDAYEARQHEPLTNLGSEGERTP